MISSFRKLVLIRRKTGGNYVNGHWQEGPDSAFFINASVQPVKGKEMESLPEGRRNTQTIKLYTNTQLQTVNDENPDIVEIFGSSFEITTVEPWQSDVISHYKCMAVKSGKAQLLNELIRIDSYDDIRYTVGDFIRIYNDRVPSDEPARITADGQIRGTVNDELRIFN